MTMHVTHPLYGNGTVKTVWSPDQMSVLFVGDPCARRVLTRDCQPFTAAVQLDQQAAVDRATMLGNDTAAMAEVCARCGRGIES